MDSFWKSALEAGEKAKSLAKTISKKGIEFAEATAEEAGKKIKDLHLTENIESLSSTISPAPKPKAPSQEELIAYGITSQYIEFIRSLNYNTFRDFSTDGAGPTDAPTSGADAPDAPVLNPWQVRHAMLVVRAVKEVNELRYVLCPRYLTDQRFWEVYFALADGHLPSVAFTWKEGDPLPQVRGGTEGAEEEFMSLGGLQGHLKSLGSRLSGAVAAAAAKGTGGVELATFLPLGSFTRGSEGAVPSGAGGGGASLVNGGGGGGSGAAAAAAVAASGALAGESSLLEADPDLEAYLQVADEAREGFDDDDPVEGDDVGGEGEEDDLDLDHYLNELSAEVDAGGGGDEGDGDDLDSVLKELQDDNNEDDESKV